MNKTLWVVIAEGGHEWLVRNYTAAHCRKAWKEEMGTDVIRVESLRGDRVRAEFLREIGQADPDA